MLHWHILASNKLENNLTSFNRCFKLICYANVTEISGVSKQFPVRLSPPSPFPTQFNFPVLPSVHSHHFHTHNFPALPSLHLHGFLTQFNFPPFPRSTYILSTQSLTFLPFNRSTYPVSPHTSPRYSTSTYKPTWSEHQYHIELIERPIIPGHGRSPVDGLRNKCM